jgi:transposase-like protein
MNVNLTDPIFHDEDKAREWLEASRWPAGPFCPHCGSVNVTRMGGTSGRPGLFHCPDCRGQFTVRTGQVMERSHIPLAKWVLAYHLMASSKKGISAHQLHRMLGIAYNSAWFMAHRIREAMRDADPTPMGGEGKVIEADEMYHGKKETPTPSAQRKGRPYLKQGKIAEKRVIFALVERGGAARAVHMPQVTAKNIRDVLVTKASRKSRLHTDESRLYDVTGTEFAKHETVNHSAKEYARGKGDDLVTTNSVEGFFGIFERGLTGIYQHCGEQHLQRYLDEFSFRYSNRVKLGVEDAQRAVLALQGAEGKRLTWRPANEA